MHEHMCDLFSAGRAVKYKNDIFFFRLLLLYICQEKEVA